MVSVETVLKAGNGPCPYCGGQEAITGVVDDIEFSFECPCSGGSEEAVRWLLGSEREPPPGEDWII